jgi:hypothetical protein
MGNDEAALLRLWREKRGEAEPDDLSGDLVVQLGAATEEVNRRWFQVWRRSSLRPFLTAVHCSAAICRHWLGANLACQRLQVGCIEIIFAGNPDQRKQRVPSRR